jgi:multidrug efflux pump subunit AcrA (membrane-fusion protein)
MKFLTVLFTTAALAAEAPRNESTVVLDATGVKNLGIETVAAEESDFERTIPVLGEIDHTCQSHSILSSRIPGKIIEALFHKGDFVKKGDVLLRIESRQPGDPPPVIELKAPADGLILARNATLGGIVGASGGALFRIAIDGDLELSASVPETSLPRLKPGMAVEVMVAGATEPTRGEVRMIEPEVSQTLRMGIVRIALTKDDAVRVGNFARGSIETMRRDSVAVPSAALVYRGSDGFLQKVTDGKVATVPVDIGVRADGFVEIVSGVAAGDEVVSRAGTFVADGDLIRPVRQDVTEVVTR